MKKSIFITLAIIFAIESKSQIILENSYDISNSNKKTGLTLIKLDLSGEKYFFYNIDSRQIQLYNLNHSIYKTINVPHLSKYRSYNNDSTVSIAYLSENLFNNDNLIEFIAFDGQYAPFFQLGPQNCGSMRVFNENGSVIFNGDSLMPTFKRDATYYGYESEGKGDFIFNTSNGSKMFLFSYKNNILSQKIYSLPGQLITSFKKNNNEYNNSLPFPNPTNNSILVPYKLENGKDGKLVINDINGKMLLEYKIDTTFDNILVDTNTMTAGNYFYSIYSSDKKVVTGKFIVTK
jgi:hypothetical protein